VLLADKYGYFEEHLFEGMSGEARRHRTSLRGDARRRFEEAWLLRRHGARPAYFTQKRDMSDLPGKTVIPVGILFKVIDDTPEAKADALAESEAAWNRYLWRNAPGESMDFTARIIVSERHYARGWFHLLRGESDLALAEFASAVSSESAIKQMWNNAGSALAEYGLLEYAVAFYEGALEIDPSYTPALRNLAACYLDLGYFENVRSHLEPVLREDPGDRAALEILAAAYEREGRFEEAVNVHSDVARRFPEDPTPWVEAGRILLEKAPNPEEARKLLTRALELDPRRMDARTLLAGLDGGKPPSVPEMGPDVALPEGMEGVPNPFSLETPGGLSLPTLPSPRPPEPPLPDPLRGPPR